MKSLKLYAIFAFIGLVLLGCQEKSPYDTSTPEKMIESLGQIGQQPADHNPIPYFYVKKDVEPINRFDNAGRITLDKFKDFKSAIRENFPSLISSENEKEIKLNNHASMFSKITFSLTASLIRDQLRNASPEDYEFVSASEPSSSGIITINYKMRGNQREVEVKNENGEFLMFMEESSYAQIDRMVDFFTKAEKVFSDAIEQINSGDLDDDTFLEQATSWNSKYMELLSLLN